jgi:hypothetical protein
MKVLPPIRKTKTKFSKIGHVTTAGEGVKRIKCISKTYLENPIIKLANHAGLERINQTIGLTDVSLANNPGLLTMEASDF